MSALAQDEFESLTIPTQCEESMFDTFRPIHSDFEERQACDAYIPFNYTPEEVCAMIDEWEISELNRQDQMEVAVSIETNGPAFPAASLSLEDYEPVRLCPHAPPPKRFYRTFWRSIARRVLLREKEAFANMM